LENQKKKKKGEGNLSIEFLDSAVNKYAGLIPVEEEDKRRKRAGLCVNINTNQSINHHNTKLTRRSIHILSRVLFHSL